MSAALAPQIDKIINPDGGVPTENEKKTIKAVSQIASTLIAGASGSDVDVAFESATNEVTNNYLNHVESKLRDALQEKLKYCTTSNQCNKDTIAKLEKAIYKLNNIDDSRDAKLIKACMFDRTSAFCSQESLKFKGSQATWQKYVSTLSKQEKDDLFVKFMKDRSNTSGINEYMQSNLKLNKLALDNAVLTSTDPAIISKVDYARRIATADIVGGIARLLGGSPETADIVSLSTGLAALSKLGVKAVVGSRRGKPQGNGKPQKQNTVKAGDEKGKLDNQVTYNIRNGIKPEPGARETAIARAWKQERELVKLTGKGTRNWTQKEMNELKRIGKVSGYTGHHRNSVANNKDWKGDPRNIDFLSNSPKGGDHLNSLQGHKNDPNAKTGSYQNPTNGRLIDRDAMIKRENGKNGK